MNAKIDLNVLGGELQTCCTTPMTGFFRTGVCVTGPQDVGTHVICAQITAEFLRFTTSQGNDLITPVPAYNFPGLKPGDRWCLCVSRWQSAFIAGVAPPVDLAATHSSALNVVSLIDLQQHQITAS
jgi:uncharacterized protein